MRKKKTVEIPSYSFAEELTNALSHGFGAVFGIVATVLCLLVASSHGGIERMAAAAIYGFSLIFLYSMSTIYHALKVNRAKRVFRVLDHCSIYILIAGTYTPYTLVALRDGVGSLMFCFIWAAAVVGIVFTAIDLKKFSVFSVVCYLVMGWVIVLAWRPLSLVMNYEGMLLLLAGGIAYTVGALLYVLGKKFSFMHSIFHFFVLVGSLLHFFSVLVYVL